MKKIVLMLVVAMSSMSAFAGEQRELSADAREIASALLDSNVVEAAGVFAQNADVVTSVVAEGVERDTTIYRISGINLMGGDIVCGSAELVITKSSIEQFGFPLSRVTRYDAETTVSSCRL